MKRNFTVFVEEHLFKEIQKICIDKMVTQSRFFEELMKEAIKRYKTKENEDDNKGKENNR